MSNMEYNKIVAEIEMLPTGGITYKKINGKEYAYYQWRENGKQRSRRAKDDELEKLLRLIEYRKELQRLLGSMGVHSDSVGGIGNFESPGRNSKFRCLVRMGEDLEPFVRPVIDWEKREIYNRIHDYIYGDIGDRVYILYGLRRTGKTTLIRQIISEMDSDIRDKTVYIQIQENKTLDDVNHDLKIVEEMGYRYVFIDEVTLLSDFIEGAALLSDIFAASGMKIVLSGTDSLGFMFAEDEELYDRCIMSHTTFIPYREFERIMGDVCIDDYIRYGGTMSLGGLCYNDRTMIFATKKSTDEYVDSAIAKNIQHSLKNYKFEGHFRSLRELYDKNELTSVINRIVEDINHRFTLEVLTRDFRSNDLRISANNLRKDREHPTDILDHIDFEKVNKKLKELLEIRNKEEQLVEIQDSHRYEIKEYLDLLDLTVEIDIRWMSDYNRKESRTVLSQPGMRYSQAEALIKSLIEDDVFRDLSWEERNRITRRIIEEIKGRMLEDMVLLETKISRENYEVFRLQFAVGEFDMVVYNPDEGGCELYEIKHSKEIVPNQCRHLLDEKKCKDVEFRYGVIKGKYVIYRGETSSLAKAGFETKEDVVYLNVEDYLLGFM